MLRIFFGTKVRVHMLSEVEGHSGRLMVEHLNDAKRPNPDPRLKQSLFFSEFEKAIPKLGSIEDVVIAAIKAEAVQPSGFTLREMSAWILPAILLAKRKTDYAQAIDEVLEDYSESFVYSGPVCKKNRMALTELITDVYCRCLINNVPEHYGIDIKG